MVLIKVFFLSCEWCVHDTTENNRDLSVNAVF